MIQFTLYSRSYCHLCDDMLDALQVALHAHGADQACTVQVVDVDADDALLALYDELVPVLVGRKANGGEQQICNYFLDHAKLKDFLS
ncbi:glutaredoxin family protein [Undibacterium sp.]|jgi:hypothetical protein|uniref:glutaredoxin family protein n=1 Tax=Undibacterium sp. TaxID=1914977 RepID=UPI002CB5201D|nr:glutaredoxin family protein [Undibacterium sp.]HTD05503.1 glutaredoxin family protein [Undibacterium sp.]